MSTRIKMALVMNILSPLFLAALVRSDQSTVPIRSFKIGENVTYDCIDIYKQPGLDHPLLRNHTIQMKPSVSRTEIKSEIGNNKTYKKTTEYCPYGTVPILRNNKEFVTNAQHFGKKYAHPLSTDSPGTHIVGVRAHGGPYHGVEAVFNGYNLNIDKDQASYSQIYIGSGLNNEVNFVSAGLMINPGFFGDSRLWSYGFWKGKDGKGCYNTACSGFVQISHVVPIVKPIDQLAPGQAEWFHWSIHQDKYTGNWWVRQVNKGAPNVYIGYWPYELFNLLGHGANLVGAGGVVQASRSGQSPPMGNGNFPSADRTGSAKFTNIRVWNSNYKLRKISYFPVEELVDGPKCYGLRVVDTRLSIGYFFNYGGPGGYFCGI